MEKDYRDVSQRPLRTGFYHHFEDLPPTIFYVERSEKGIRVFSTGLNTEVEERDIRDCTELVGSNLAYISNPRLLASRFRELADFIESHVGIESQISSPSEGQEQMIEILVNPTLPFDDPERYRYVPKSQLESERSEIEDNLPF